MKAVVFHGIGDIRLDNVKEPGIKDPNDAILRITNSAICGTDLHMVRGTLTGMKPGRILGHEAVGTIEDVGKNVRNLKKGDRVVVGSTIACGNCSYCRAGYYAQCDKANPNGPTTAFFGGPETAGGFDGLQAEFARIPFANVGAVKIPEAVTDEQAILLSDIFPTGYMAAEIADVEPGRTVAVFGCGPVGQFAIASLKLMDAGRIIAIDNIPSRLEMAQQQGAEVINFDDEDPVQAIKEMTAGIGVDRAIDAVGVDANRPHHGPGEKKTSKMKKEFDRELKDVAPETKPKDGNWEPGDAPSMALQWAVEALAKAGKLSIIGVYPDALQSFPIGTAMFKNLVIRMGNCHHRKYIPKLLEMVAVGLVEPTKILTHSGPLTGAIEAYKDFDRREPGWVKVMLEPQETKKAA